MGWIIFIIVSVLFIALVAFSMLPTENKKDKQPKKTFDYYEKRGITIPGGSARTNYADDEKIRTFQFYLDFYKDFTEDELRATIDSTKKENYSQYSDADKQQWRALKTLLENKMN